MAIKWFASLPRLMAIIFFALVCSVPLQDKQPITTTNDLQQTPALVSQETITLNLFDDIIEQIRDVAIRSAESDIRIPENIQAILSS